MITHLRDLQQPTRALCGVGYDWPSTISLTSDLAQVTCRNCQLEAVREAVR